jgi:membrane protease YdiL (CAAX protease family)
MMIMAPLLRLASGTALFLAVYFVSLFVLPGVKPLADAVERIPGAGPSTLTQSAFLAFSLLFIMVIGKRRFGLYGFRLAPWRAVGGALRLGLMVSVPWTLVFMIAMAALMGPTPATDGAYGASGGLWAVLLSIPFLASVCEETFYRGFLQNYLKPLGPAGLTVAGLRLSVPVLFSATAFGLGHLCLLAMMPPPVVAFIVVSCFLSGTLAGLQMEQTGSLIPPILIHLAFNASGALLPWLAGTFLTD